MRIEEIRTDLCARLCARREEIEQATLTRVYAVSDPGGVADPSYVDGLRTAVAAAVDYGISGIESSERNPPPIPAALLVQARVAARNGIGLETVLRRYFAGYALLGDFLVEEAEAEGIEPGGVLKRLLQAQAASFDRLLAAISEEHVRESEDRLDTAEEHRVKLVQRLLAGERFDTIELAYELETSHLGLVARGPGSAEAIRGLATTLDRRLLLIRRGEGVVWAWLGGRRPLERGELDRVISSTISARVAIALGEPGEGVGGWRLSHRQAAAAMPIAMRGPKAFVRYADVALLASMFQDELLSTSLRQLYLKPLARERDGGETARETLRAYFTSGRNVTSAAAALGVNRNTIANRIRAIETMIGSPLAASAGELEAALRLAEFDSAGVTNDGHIA